MGRVLLGMGSNLGDRRAHLRAAIAGLGPMLTRTSAVYETKPVGGPAQPLFLNLVVELDVDLSPRELLGVCQRLEAAADRVRTVPWGPRTLDVDILWVEGVTVDEPDLVIPHPRMQDRRFVMAPLAEIAPDLVPADEPDRATGEVVRLGPL